MTKIVLIGGPCSGKSTLLQVLYRRGFSVIPEVARDVITAFIDFTLPNDERISCIQRAIVEQQLIREQTIDSENITFIDRGIYDVIPYCISQMGRVPSDIESLINSHNGYDYVFALDRLPFVSEPYRLEKSDEEAQYMHDLVLSEYINRGYILKKIPTFTDVAIRADYVMRLLL